jgi:adenylate kinase family enzyme
VAFVRRVLRSGALLENETFHIAQAIFDAFAAERGLRSRDLVVLNGLPRHAGQAADVDGILDVRMVVRLACSPEVVVERIRLNTGGDRTGRTDDSTADIVRKLRIYEQRTAPLVDHYRAKGVRIEKVDIGARTTPEQLHARLPPAP